MVEGTTVVCGNCGSPSPAGKKFCAECGASLPLSCRSCGAPVDSSHKFCAECGTPLAAPPSAPPIASVAPVSAAPSDLSSLTGEEQRMDRRLVSILFCDLVGFTPLSERLDAEEVREVQDAYFDLMSAEIERLGGTVEKYAGDAVLAIFGAPIVHGDDAERAVLCALAMHHALIPLATETLATRGVNLMLRIGINTGEVVSGLREGGGRIDYAVTGDAVNTAARYQTAAEPGGVMVGEMTMHHARRGIHFGEKQMLTLKGKKEPVPGYTVLGPREHLAERWELTSHTARLIGRDAELQLLQDTWAVASTGAGRAVEIAAEPGIGKSRLLAEARDRFSAAGPLQTVRGRCVSYSTQVSLWLVADVLRDVFHLPEHAAAAEIIPVIDAGVENILIGITAEDREIAADVFGEALGLPPGDSILAGASAQVRHHGLVRSLGQLFGAIAVEAPVLLVLEDIHWIDIASREILVEALGDLPSLHLLAITARRPESEPLFGDALWSQRIDLQPLESDDAMSLAAAILGGIRLSLALQEDIAERSGGNPFFLEELLREMREADALEERNGEIHLRPGAHRRLPSTLQELLLSRLDRLERLPRAVAQVGSVIGRTFAVRLLAGTLETDANQLDAPLEGLHRADIALPWNGPERVYAFKHATVQETAYHTLLKKARQALHGTTARAVIRLYPTDEYVDIIAYHYAQTDEHANAATWLERSADRAAAVFANDVAIEHYRETRRRQDIIDAPASDRARVDEKLGRILRIAAKYDEALVVLEQAAGAYFAGGDTEAERHAVAEIGRVHRSRGTTVEGIDRVREFLTRQDGVAPTSGLAALHVVLARLYFTLGKYDEEVEDAHLGAEMAGIVGDRRVLVEAEMSRSIGLYHLGHTEDALASMEAAIPIADEFREFEVLANLLNNVAMIHREAGDFGGSRERREQSAQVNERIGDKAMHAFAIAGLGEVAFVQGDWPGAHAYLQQAEAMVRSLGTSWYFFLPLALLGQFHAARGEFSQAATYLEEALTTARENGQDIAIRGIIDRLAEMDLIQSNLENSLARYDGILNLSALDEGDATLTASLPIVAWACLENGEAVRAASLARLATERAVTEHAIVDLLAAERIAGMAAGRLHSRDEASSHFEKALALARRIGYPHAEGLVLYEWGCMLLDDRNNHDALTYLTQAHEILRHLGARPYLERIEGVLFDRGIPTSLTSHS